VSSLDLPMSRESGLTPLNKGMNSGNRRGVGQAITWTYESRQTAPHLNELGSGGAPRARLEEILKGA